GGWLPLDDVAPEVLDATARAGIREVASAIPDGVGEQIVRKVRGEVWGKPIVGAAHVPASAAFAAFALGCRGDGPLRVYASGPWTRLTTARGHVLVKRRAWNLLR